MLGSSRSLPEETGVLAAAEGRAPRTYTYARSHRILEVCGLIVSAALTALTALLTVRALPSGGEWLAALAGFGGLCLADLLSGLVHWSADTYGTPTMPIFGGFVRTFREHHADQVDITRHDFIETNGDVCIFSVPVHLALLLTIQNAFALASFFGLFVGSYANSQIHKWAHSAEAPRLIRACQRARVFLSPRHHSRHHAGSHLTHYCITTGWMNALLDRLGFFRLLESLLSKLGVRRTT